MNHIRLVASSPEESKARRKRSAIYCRVSSREQEKQGTIKIQVRRLTQEIQKKGWYLVDKYIDDGYSGELMERPDLDRLQNEIKERRIEVVLITDPDRLSRDFISAAVLRQEIKERGAQVIFLSFPPATTPEQELGQRVVAAAADYERKKIYQRTRLGKLSKARSGLIVGARSPYGYRYLARTRQGPGGYEIVELQAQWVRRIFSWYTSEALSPEKIARRLTELGIPTPSGKKIWRISTIQSILGNESYAGKAYYNKHRAIPPKNPRQLRRYPRLKNTSSELRPKEQWIGISVPAIIDRKTWELAQKRAKTNAKLARRNTRHPYLLRGKLVCGNCKHPYYGMPARGQLRYNCSNRHHMAPLPKTCSAKSRDASVVDSTVWHAITQALAHPDLIVDQLKALETTDARAPNYSQERLNTIERKLEKLKAARERVHDAYLTEGFLTKNEYREQLRQVQVKKEKLEKERVTAEAQVSRLVNWRQAQQNIKLLYNDIRFGLHNLHFENKRKVIELLIDRVVLFEDKVRIEGIIPSARPTNNKSVIDVIGPKLSP